MGQKNSKKSEVSPSRQSALLATNSTPIGVGITAPSFSSRPTAIGGGMTTSSSAQSTLSTTIRPSATTTRPLTTATQAGIVSSRPMTTYQAQAIDPYGDLAAQMSAIRLGLTPAFFILSAINDEVCLFHPSTASLEEVYLEDVRCKFHLKKGDLVHVSLDAQGYVQTIVEMSRDDRRRYLERRSFSFGLDQYRRWILPALLVGSRVRDYEQRCGRVETRLPLVIVIPQQNQRIKTIKLRTEFGENFTVQVTRIEKDDQAKQWWVTCQQMEDDEIPARVTIGSLLDLVNIRPLPPRVTDALTRFHARNPFQPKETIHNGKLIECLYGPPASKIQPGVSPFNHSLRLANNGASVILNPEQSESVTRYISSSCPGLVVEAPPGSGKTLTAAAMALTYKNLGGTGVQLFLSTANVPVFNMAIALAKLDYGNLKALHFVSQEREDQMNDETRSPFSILSLARANSVLANQLIGLERELLTAETDEEKNEIREDIRNVCYSVLRGKFDVVFATVDMILGRLAKPNKNPNKIDPIKKQLMNEVTRIVIDEASQMTEAALNSLILSFPQAQIVLIGDSKQLPPFKYEKDDVVSELAARSALEVAKDKRNLPVINLRRVYRASPNLIKHYSDAFYDSQLVSLKLESTTNPLEFLGQAARGGRCIFMQVKGKVRQIGTSKSNPEEAFALINLLVRLKDKGYAEKDVMIISYYEAQRRLVENMMNEEYEHLGLKGYEVLTVDSAQGREKRVVIVLTTRNSVPTQLNGFVSCPLRCNVAVSRHQEALIVLGHSSLAVTPAWMRVLSKNYFNHIDNPFGSQQPQQNNRNQKQNRAPRQKANRKNKGNRASTRQQQADRVQ